MKAWVLTTVLGLSQVVGVLVSMLRPTLGQHLALSLAAFGLGLLGTVAVLYLWRPVGITARQAAATVWGSLVWLLVLLAVIIGFRQQPGVQFTLATDSAIQTEVALGYLEQGKNPYVEDYYGTALEQYDYPAHLAPVNPALTHLVYLPATLWLSYPVYELAQGTLGWFDQRFTLALALFLLVGTCWWFMRGKPETAVLIAPLIIANPWFSYHLLSGQNDVLPLALVVAALSLWVGRRFTAGTVLLALAAATKQTVWFALPFAALYLWRALAPEGGGSAAWWRQCGWFAIVVAVAFAPFMFWNAPALLEDTVGYIVGTTAHTYPMWGVGLAEALVRLNLVPTRSSDFPFVWLQLLVALPVGAWLIHYARRVSPAPSYVLAAWALWLTASWLVARFFAPAHLGFIITTLAVAYLMHPGAPPARAST